MVQNVGTEASMDWVLSHMQDPDFNEPLPTASSSLGPAYKPDPESLVMLTSMGFTDRQVSHFDSSKALPYSSRA